MRDAVVRLVKLGRFPDELAEDLTPEQIDQYADLLESIERPVSDEEASALCKLFGTDNFYGVAWTMLHLIETAPGWPIKSCLAPVENLWIDTLRKRAQRAGYDV